MSFSQLEKERIRNILGFFIKESNKDILYMALFKRLFFLDRQAFLETGVPITKYSYSAKPLGPVPIDLEMELKGKANPNAAVEADSVIRLRKPSSPKADSAEGFFDLVDNNWKINEQIFTLYEIELLQRIAEGCKQETGKQLSHYSHDCASWVKAFHEKGEGAHITFYDEAGSSDDPYTPEERERLDSSRLGMELLLSDAEMLNESQ